MSKWAMYRRRGSAPDNSIVSGYVSRVIAAGGTVSAATQVALNTFVQNALNTDTWQLLSEVWPCCGSNLAASLVKLKIAPGTAGSYMNTNFVGGDYAETGASGGLKGDGATKSLSGGPLTSTLGSNGHLCAYSPLTTGGAGNRCMIGGVDSGDQGWLGSLSFGTSMDCRIGGVTTASQASATSAGLWIASRVTSTDLRLFLSGIQVGFSNTLTAACAVNYSMSIFAYNNAGLNNAIYSGRLAFATVGVGLTSQQCSVLTSLVAAFNTALSR